MNYKNFYEKTFEYLIKKAKKHNVSKEKLMEYFVPGSAKNKLPGEPMNNNLDRIFCRLCFHAQNGTMISGVINYNKNYKEIKSIACDFKPAKVLTKYKNSNAIFKLLKDKIPHKEKKTQILERYSKTIYSGAKFIAQFESYEKFIEKLLSYDEFAPSYVMFNVVGMKTLAYDFLKELDSRFDICKPDLHLVACMKSLFDMDDIKDKNSLNYHVSRKCKELANGISAAIGDEVSTYTIDKMLYLVCTETFYNDDNVKNKDDKKRKAYLRYIKPLI